MRPEALEDLLLPKTALREVEPGIFSALPDGTANSYDAAGALAFYDLVACNPVYNRLMWGYWPSTLHDFCSSLLKGADGWYLDAGCGSLAFSAKAYAETDRPLILVDLSLTLLRKAKERLDNDNAILLQADVTALPFRAHVIDTIMSMNMLHVLPDLDTALADIQRVMTPGGTAGFTTLIATGRWSDGYMRMWEDKGEIISRDQIQIEQALASNGLKANIRLHGNMSFITTDAAVD